jgi:hypothetical protein
LIQTITFLRTIKISRIEQGLTKIPAKQGGWSMWTFLDFILAWSNDGHELIENRAKLSF